MGALAPPTVLRERSDATDKISAVFGNDQSPLVSTPPGIYNAVHPGVERILHQPGSSDSSQIWNTTATPPSVLKDPLQVCRRPPLAGCVPQPAEGYFRPEALVEREHPHRCVLVRLNTAANALPTDGRG